MTQNNRECNESDKNIPDESDIVQSKPLQATDQIQGKKKRPNTDSIYDFIARTCATNIIKEQIELVIEELNTQNVKFNEKTAQDLDSF